MPGHRILGAQLLACGAACSRSREPSEPGHLTCAAFEQQLRSDADERQEHSHRAVPEDCRHEPDGPGELTGEDDGRPERDEGNDVGNEVDIRALLTPQLP